MEFAVKNAEGNKNIRCPRNRCGNLSIHTSNVVTDYLFFNGFDLNQKNWFWHEEEISKCVSPKDDQFESQHMDFEEGNTVEMVNDAYKDCGNPTAFKELLEHAEKPLYEGCSKFTKLGALVKLFNRKGKFGWSDNSFTELLCLVADLLPEKK